MASAKSDPETLTQDLAEQVRHGRIEKVEQPSTRFISSPLGLATKSNGKWRRIHHLSFPAGKSVNDHIQAEWDPIEYTSFDDTVQSLLRVGTGAILVKRDLADAFRHIPVSQNDTWLLGFFWEGTYWVEKFLPFGLRTSPMLFDLFAKGLHWTLLAKGGTRCCII